MQTTSDAIASVDEDAAESTYLAYRIGCGPWQLAVDAQWATGILDSYLLQAIPRAPQWMVGCTNVDGLLVPVIDLLMLLDPTAVRGRHPGNKTRVLVGNPSPQDNEESIGLVFTGLPRQLTCTRTALPSTLQAPPLLCRMARGLALSPDSPVAIELDTRHLIDHCISQLAALDHDPA